MIEPGNFDNSTWGAIGTGMAVAITGAVTFFVQRHKRAAEGAALSAERSASEAAEFANESITRALARLDSEIVALRETIKAQADLIEIMRQREHKMAINIERLKGHVTRLADIMRSRGIDPPAFDMGEA